MYQLKNINYLELNNISLEELDSRFFHFCDDEFLDIYDSVGMSPKIGNNSKGIDFEPSIFFSKGVEGVLELWDVWFKWKADRLFNPQNKEKSTDTEIKEWFNYFSSGEFLNDDELLNKVFDIMIEEMERNSYYLLDIKENEDFTYDQVDHKKESAIENAKERGYLSPMTTMMYGKFSDFSTPIVDKWNMQTIPGKNITITPDKLTRVSFNGKTDLVSIVVVLYERYKKESKIQVYLPVLDKFISYVKSKGKSL